jgi:hypothetical protein
MVGFASDLRKTALETHEMLRTAFSDNAVGSTGAFGWFSQFKHKETSVEDEHSGHPSSGCTDGNMEEVCRIVSIVL